MRDALGLAQSQRASSNVKPSQKLWALNSVLFQQLSHAELETLTIDLEDFVVFQGRRDECRTAAPEGMKPSVYGTNRIWCTYTFQVLVPSAQNNICLKRKCSEDPWTFH